MELRGPLPGAPSRNRIHNLLIRSQTLYPVELWAQISYVIIVGHFRFVKCHF
jgi:hypothetical protein